MEDLTVPPVRRISLDRVPSAALPAPPAYGNGNGKGPAGVAAGYGSSIKVDDAGHDRFFLPRSAPILDEQRNIVGAVPRRPLRLTVATPA